MLKSLTLTNFGKHEDLTLNFGPGLNVIRAANEDGKSTLYTAIAYAFWGTRALPLSLSETVTWGKPEVSLRSGITFSVADSDYTISRGKSGAELHGPGVVVTGQLEVSAYVEKLLRANHLVGQATLLSAQGDLQRGLESSTASLIDKLSDMAMIDYFVDKVQTNLPTGSTKMVDAQLEAYEALTRPSADFSELEATVSTASKTLEDAAAAVRAQQERIQGLESLAEVSRKWLAAEESRLERLLRLIARKKVLEAVPMAACASREALDRLEALAVVETRNKEAFSNFQRLKASLPAVPKEVIPVEAKELAKQHQALSDTIRANHRQLTAYRIKLAELSAKKIADGECSICGMQIGHLPAVQDKNAAIDLESEKVHAEVSNLEQEQSRLLELSESWSNALSVNEQLQRLLPFGCITNKAVTPWSFDLGAEPEPVSSNYHEQYLRAKAEYAASELARNAYDAAQNELQELLVQLEEVSTPLDIENAKVVIRSLNTARSELTVLSAALDRAKTELHATQRQLDAAVAKHQAEIAAYEAAMQAKSQLQEQRVVLIKHNTLIKKLREAKPAISRSLWSVLVGGISQVFSQVRGVQSSVTRGESGWLIDGRPAEAYSGSTKDSLALAIRVLLLKRFMPTTDFMLLDEPAAGCDVEREVNMLSAIVRADLTQTILVTHSDLADTLANNIITL